MPAEKLEFELSVGTRGSRADRISFRHEKDGKEVDVKSATDLDDLIGLRGPTHLTFQFTEEEIILSTGVVILTQFYITNDKKTLKVLT